MNVELVSQTKPHKPYFKKKLQELVDNKVITQEEADSNYENLNAEQLIIYIARVSSSRDNKLEDYEKLLKYLIDHKHWSPFQMADMCVEITTSRAISHQLIRHQSFDFQEFSQRYSKVTEFEDVELREQPDNNRQSSGKPLGNIKKECFLDTDKDKEWKSNVDSDFNTNQSILYSMDSLAHIEEAYYELLEAGVARETARFILPLCTQTTLYMKGSLRSWIHFLDVRDDEHAQKEAREVAQEAGKIFQQQYPIISKALGFEYE